MDNNDEASKEGLVKDISNNLLLLTNGLVADYISKVCPIIGQNFKNDNFLRFSAGHTLEEVVRWY